MSSKRPLFPKFIEKLDSSLLLNNPVTWSTRIHLVAWYGGLFTLFLALLCFIVPDDSRAEDLMGYWITVLVVSSLIAFIIWLIFLLRFNVFKRYGQWKKTDTLKTFLLYFLATALIVSWSFIPLIVQSVRANWAYSTSEMTRDMNEMNLKVLQLERDSVSTKFEADTFRIDNSMQGAHTVETPYYLNDNIDDGSYFLIDTATLRLRLENADRFEKLSDSMYVIYTSPRYTFVQNWSISEDSTVKTLGSYDLYKLVFNSNQQYNGETIRRELTELIRKYRVPSARRSYYYSGIGNPNASYFQAIQEKYMLDHVNDALSNIAEKKYRWSDGMIEFAIKFIYYTSLILSLLVMMFRHMTRKAFFLSLLAGVVITILTTVFSIGSFQSEYGILVWLLIYFVAFVILAATIFGNRTRSLVPGIALNLAISMVSFVPLIMTELYYSILSQKYRKDPLLYSHLFENKEMHFRVAEISGLAILLLLLATLAGAAYKRWYSLPEL